ncbi:transcriptional repressor [Bifidobacterium callitrichos]|uniref:Transcriptional repressor n=1 Tax=Bifidobacterium callitrichos TaxID=762209 RepID=A0A2T3GB30_9BIFI|nr:MULTISPECIES: transcriptional repressor [Bifidobacterium]KAA8819345.1 transcriptional repressor [Bifidobacterium rousetti]PST46673.1 transcriptional repressor [Bifidobacterium callitrichos]
MVEHIERQTKQKDAIRAALADCDEFISAQDLHRRLEDSGLRIGLATVYRQLNALADSGAADTIRLDGQQLFRLCGDDGHHHHLVCRKCGRTVEIDPPSEAWLRKVAEGHGFTVESHTLEVFGLCPECQQTQRSSAPGL